MAIFPTVSAQDGPQLTVSDIVKSPLVIPQRLLDITDALFIADKLLRSAPTAEAGVVKYYETTPLYSLTKSKVVGEFGQIPVATNALGQLKVTQTAKRGLGVRISKEMVDRNRIDDVNLQIKQVSNTMVRDFDGLFMALSLAACAASGHTVAASTGWDSSTAATRKDISQAKYQIASSVAPGTTDNFLGYKADTIVLNLADIANMEGNDDTWKAWVGNVADKSVAVTGELPLMLFGLNVWGTYNIPIGEALVCERQTLGFISDERPLQASPLRWLDDTEEFRSNMVRSSAMAIDQPLSMCTISGI